MKDQDLEEFFAIRKAEGLKIDPDTAEVYWEYAQILDPYGMRPDPPEEWHCVGRVYFARSPGSDIWVWFGDLPEKTCRALQECREEKIRETDEKLDALWLAESPPPL
jgi:hypothetical protein